MKQLMLVICNLLSGIVIAMFMNKNIASKLGGYKMLTKYFSTIIAAGCTCPLVTDLGNLKSQTSRNIFTATLQLFMPPGDLSQDDY